MIHIGAIYLSKIQFKRIRQRSAVATYIGFYDPEPSQQTALGSKTIKLALD
jgi:hypothetical protein